MRRLATLAFVVLFASLSAAEDAVTAALDPYSGTGGVAGPFDYYTPLRIQVGEKPGETLVKEPTYVSGKPLYGSFPLGSGADATITVVLDEPEVGVTSFLWVDANNDNDLTNDGDGRWKKGNATNFISDFELTVRYAVEGKETTGPYFMRFYRFKDFSKRATLLDKVMCYRSNHREGRLTLAGKEYRVCVSDDNTDGRFDDLDNGRVAIDIDGDGRLDGGKDSAEGFLLSEPFNVNGVSWRVRAVSAQGDSITLVPAGIDVPPKGGAAPPPANPPPVNPPPVNPPPPQPKAPTLEELQAKFQEERSKPYNERYATIQQIGALHTREAADFLRAALGAETEAVVRTYLVNALAANGTPEAFRYLVAFLDHEKEDAGLRASLARALGEFSTEEAFKRLVALYKESRKDDAVRYAAAQAVRGFTVEEFGKEMDRFFLDALDDTYAQVRAEAVRFLAPKKDKRVLAVAKEILAKETLALVRQAAVEALKCAGTQDAFLALFEAAGKESDEATKKAMVDAMVTFTDPAVVRWVSQQGTSQKDPALRRVAVALLGRSKEPAAIKAVVKALRDSDASV
ncbi:MAG: HEAT repeat domain-containing protein, partial [Planctomycetota bacterium]